MLSTSIGYSTDLMVNANATNSGSKSVTFIKPKFKDDGAVHVYTLNWHPDYVEILMDNVRIQFEAFNKLVPSEFLKLTFIARPSFDTQIFNTYDSTFWINTVSYDADITHLKKIVPDGKGGYNLV